MNDFSQYFFINFNKITIADRFKKVVPEPLESYSVLFTDRFRSRCY